MLQGNVKNYYLITHVSQNIHYSKFSKKINSHELENLGVSSGAVFSRYKTKEL
jgi:hypothetical protein